MDILAETKILDLYPKRDGEHPRPFHMRVFPREEFSRRIINRKNF